MLALRPTPWLMAYLASGALTVVLTVIAATRGRGPARRRLVALLAAIAGLLFTNGFVFAAADEASAIRCVRLAQATAAWLPLFGLLFAVRLGRRRLSVLLFLAALVTRRAAHLPLGVERATLSPGAQERHRRRLTCVGGCVMRPDIGHAVVAVAR